MRFQVFLANFATTIFLVENCEAVHTLLLSDIEDDKAKAPEKTNNEKAGAAIDGAAQNILLDMDGTVDEKIAAGKLEMKKAMMNIPYLKEVIIGGELASLAFDYMKSQAPEGMRKTLGGAYASGVKGRFTAFKSWLSQAWSGKTELLQIIGDYEDYLSLFPTNSDKPRISLHQYFDATRAPGDRGNFSVYKDVINRMGLDAEKGTYVGIRQESRNSALRAQYIDTIAKINILEGNIA